MKKKLRYLILLMIASAVWQVSSYLWLARRSMPVAGIKSLSDFALARNGKFVVLDSDAWTAGMSSRLAPRQQKSLERFFERLGLIVYHSVDDVPESGKIFEPATPQHFQSYETLKSRPEISRVWLERYHRELERGRTLAAFDQGTALNWKLERSGLFWMKCTSCV